MTVTGLLDVLANVRKQENVNNFNDVQEEMMRENITESQYFSKVELEKKTRKENTLLLYNTTKAIISKITQSLSPG